MTPFKSPNRYMKNFTSELTASLIAAANDISLIIDEDGVIQDVAVGSEDSSMQSAIDWIGRPWADTVTLESQAKIKDLLRDSSSRSPSRWRQVNHPVGDGPDLPILYKSLSYGSDGRTVAFGRDLRPMSHLQQQLLDVQHSMERDYARLHQAETRYRMLFTMASEAILIVDADSRKVVEANPAAGRLLDKPVGKLVNRIFPRGFSDNSVDAIEDLLMRVRAAGRADDITVRTASSDTDLRLAATLLRREEDTLFLVRLSSSEFTPADTVDNKLLEIVQRSPDGFVVTNPDGIVLAANRAFLDLCQLATQLQVSGQPLDRWLGRPGVDINLLQKNLRQRSQVRQFATMLRPEYGGPIDVELSAVSALDSDEPCFGYVIRSQAPRTPIGSAAAAQPLAQSLEEMTELVGRVPLKDLVRETTDIIERMCIESALKITGDNRASAAEMLGLSRQSLYVKLRRYGLGDLANNDDS